MTLRDTFALAWGSLAFQPRRTLLIALAMSIGVGAVVVLTALGEGARHYVLDQFASLGSNLLIVLPGRAETTGAAPGVLSGETTRDLTLSDADAVARLRGVAQVAPLNIGVAQVSHGGLNREVVLLGTTSNMLDIRHMGVAEGHYLPPGPSGLATPVCVLGSRIRGELFGAGEAVGEWLRLGDRRFRVVGVLAPQGQQMGFDSDETVAVPVAAAQQMFNTLSLFRVMVEVRGRGALAQVKEDVLALLKSRHENEADVTVITQDAVLATFDRILTALTLAVSGIAAISLGVAGVLIMNVMLVSVTQRRSEIGLLKALGATASQVRGLFLAEAGLIAVLGATGGLIVGVAASDVLGRIYPALPIAPPLWAMAAAVATALASALLFAWLPARRAAKLDAALALARR